jgi:magnesium chelatase subunit D
MKNRITLSNGRTVPRVGSKRRPVPPPVSARTTVYPFSAIVGQDEMKLALLLNVVDVSIGGALVMGERGTGKSTAVRSLAALLPQINVVRGCSYNCDPLLPDALCEDCRAALAAGVQLAREERPVPVIELPLGATEDRVAGAIDIERALSKGQKAFEPGLLARANRGFLYVDEVNLLEDHLVDLLLDAAATGLHQVEREGLSVTHPARFVLVGSGNPEEGDLRPQLLDRFGLSVEVRTENEPAQRVEIMKRCESFAADPANFLDRFAAAQSRLRRSIVKARKDLGRVQVSPELMRRIATLSSELRIYGHRGELTVMKAARALAVLEGRSRVSSNDVRRIAGMALRHRLRRDVLDGSRGSAQLEQALEQFSNAETPAMRTSVEPDSVESDDDPDNGGSVLASASVNQSDRNGHRETPEGAIGADTINQPLAPLATDESAVGAITSFKSKTDRPSPTGRRRFHGPATAALPRGRYSSSGVRKGLNPRVAVDATLRSGLTRRTDGSPPANGALQIHARDLRYKQFSGKLGTLFILAVDASGSMAAGRIRQAEDALLKLFRYSYINRDSVALIAFRGRTAEILGGPGRNITGVTSALGSLRVGGGTPLSAGLAAALSLVERGKQAQRKILILFTDGGANVALRDRNAQSSTPEVIRAEVNCLAAELRRRGVNILVAAPRQEFSFGARVRALATDLGATVVSLGFETL